MKKLREQRKESGYDLAFLDQNLEFSYQNYLKNYQTIYLKGFLMFLILFSVCVWLVNPYDINFYNTKALVFVIINFLFLFISIIKVFRENKIQHPQLWILALQFYLCISYVEVSSEVNSLFKSGISLGFSSLLVELLLLAPMMARCSWKLTLFSCIILNIYLEFRLTDFKDNSSLKGYPALMYLLNAVTISLSSYIGEKLDRNFFHQSKINEASLSKFQHLIKKVIPLSILIYSKGKIVFFNNETLRMLGFNRRNPVEDHLKKIILKEKKSDGSVVILSSKNDPDSILLREKKDFNLLDFLVESERNHSKFECGFECFWATLLESEMNQGLKEKCFNVKISSFAWEGAESLIIFISEDFISQKMRFLTEQANYKDKILATVSHNLKTPMNGVVGVVEMILEGAELSVSLRKDLLLVLRSAKILLFIISDIMDMTQITNGKLLLMPTTFPLIEITKEVCKLIKFQAKKKGLSFEIVNKFESNLIYFHSDPQRIQQILYNLLSNALKFTEFGFIRIYLEPVENIELPTLSKNVPTAVKFTVEDSGCGIRNQDLKKLFCLFGNLEIEEQKGNLTGIGLGLTISKMLVNFLNQKVNKNDEAFIVESKPGAGSRFSFVLKPFTENEKIDDSSFGLFENDDLEEGCKEIETRLFSIKSEKKLKRVLVVDDDQINITVLSSFFKSFPEYTCSYAFNGQQAVNLVEESIQTRSFYDIILMDCNMPVMDGFEATKIINEMIRAHQIPDIPIIAASANSSPDDFHQCFLCGMKGFLAKPFSKQQLKQKMDKLLKGNEASISLLALMIE